MIKRFITKLEATATEAMIAILHYIDDSLDDHSKRLDDLEERLDEFEDGFNSTKAEVKSQSDTRKLVKKVVVTTVVGGAVTFILKHFGIF